MGEITGGIMGKTIDPVRDFDEDIFWVMEECKELVGKYLAPFSLQAIEYIKRKGLAGEKFKGGGLSHLFPFWLQETFGLDRKICRRISLANTFGLLYFYVQDEVMDSKAGEYTGGLLPLANMFLVDFMAQYRSLFSSDARLWQISQPYMQQWAYSVFHERKEHWGKATPYIEDDLIWIGWKAAPVKMTCAAMAILSGREHLIEPLCQAVDYNQVVFQLLDDWRDWREDLEKGNYTWFLTQVIKEYKLEEAGQLNESHVKRAIFSGSIMQELFSLEKKYSSLALDSLSGVHAPYFQVYIRRLLGHCEEVYRKVLEERKAMMCGGLGYILRKAARCQKSLRGYNIY